MVRGSFILSILGVTAEAARACGRSRASSSDAHISFGLACMGRGFLTPPPRPPILYMGWVGVGWQRHSKTCRSPLELDNQGSVCFFFGGRPQLVFELDHLCEVNNLCFAQGN